MKKLFWFLLAVLITIPTWADDLQPEPLGQEIKEYKALSTGDVDPGNHEVWKLYIIGSLIPSGNYNHETEIYVGSLFPGGPYIAYLRINQLYNFLQPIPKVGDVIAVEGRVVSHFNSTIQGPTKTTSIPVVYFYIENASKLPLEPEAAAQILGTKLKPTPTSAPVSQAITSASTSLISAAPVTATPGFFKADPGTPTH